MARGFESKDVEFQQAEAAGARTPRRTPTSDERETSTRRQRIELTLVKARAELASATNPAHRRMLEHAIDALLGELNNSSG